MTGRPRKQNNSPSEALNKNTESLNSGKRTPGRVKDRGSLNHSKSVANGEDGNVHQRSDIDTGSVSPEDAEKLELDSFNGAALLQSINSKNKVADDTDCQTSDNASLASASENIDETRPGIETESLATAETQSSIAAAGQEIVFPIGDADNGDFVAKIKGNGMASPIRRKLFTDSAVIHAGFGQRPNVATSSTEGDLLTEEGSDAEAGSRKSLPKQSLGARSALARVFDTVSESMTEDESAEEAEGSKDAKGMPDKGFRGRMHRRGKRKSRRGVARSVSASSSSSSESLANGLDKEAGDNGTKSSDAEAGFERDGCELESKRLAALDDLQNIERQFTDVRSKLYEERIGSISEEFALLKRGLLPELRKEFERLDAELAVASEVLGAQKNEQLRNAEYVQVVSGKMADQSLIFNRAQWRLDKFKVLRKRKFQLKQDNRKLEDRSFFHFLYRSKHLTEFEPLSPITPPGGEHESERLISAAVFRQVLYESGSPFLYANPNKHVNRRQYPTRPFRPVCKRLPDALAVVAAGGFPAATIGPTSRTDIFEDLEALKLWKGPLVPVSQQKAYHFEASTEWDEDAAPPVPAPVQRPLGKQKRGRKPLAYHQAMQAQATAQTAASLPSDDVHLAASGLQSLSRPSSPTGEASSVSRQPEAPQTQVRLPSVLSALASVSSPGVPVLAPPLMYHNVSTSSSSLTSFPSVSTSSSLNMNVNM